MTTDNHPKHARVRRAITSALENVAATHVAEAILRVALARARLESLPMDATELADFVSGPLFQRMSSVVGDDAAGEVRDDLVMLVNDAEWDAECDEPTDAEPHSRRAIASRRLPPATWDFDPTPPHGVPASDAETARPPQRGGAAIGPSTRRARVGDPLFVVIGSLDSRKRLELARCLGPDTAVLRAEDVMELVEAVEAASPRSPVVVLDCASPAVHPTTFAAMMPDLASGIRVVLWGIDDQAEHDALASVAPATSRWIRVPSEVRARDLALLVGLTTRA